MADRPVPAMKHAEEWEKDTISHLIMLIQDYEQYLRGKVWAFSVAWLETKEVSYEVTQNGWNKITCMLSPHNGDIIGKTSTGLTWAQVSDLLYNEAVKLWKKVLEKAKEEVLLKKAMKLLGKKGLEAPC